MWTGPSRPIGEQSEKTEKGMKESGEGGKGKWETCFFYTLQKVLGVKRKRRKKEVFS